MCGLEAMGPWGPGVREGPRRRLISFFPFRHPAESQRCRLKGGGKEEEKSRHGQLTRLVLV